MVIRRPHLGHFIGVYCLSWPSHLAEPVDWSRSPQTRLAFPAKPSTLPLIRRNSWRLEQNVYHDEP